jgi:hypothetical protein
LAEPTRLPPQLADRIQLSPLHRRYRHNAFSNVNAKSQSATHNRLNAWIFKAFYVMNFFGEFNGIFFLLPFAHAIKF